MSSQDGKPLSCNGVFLGAAPCVLSESPLTRSARVSDRAARERGSAVVQGKLHVAGARFVPPRVASPRRHNGAGSYGWCVRRKEVIILMNELVPWRL